MDPNPPVRILLVEDNPGDVDLVREALREQRVEIDDVARRAEAERLIRERRYDAVLLDLSLPDASSMEGVRALHALAPDLPIVVLTNSGDTHGAHAVAEGAQDYLRKGELDGGVVLRSLRYAIERQQHSLRARLLGEARAAQASAEAGQRWAALLSEASRRLAASLDYRTILTTMTQLSVPALAQCCIVELTTPDNVPTRLFASEGAPAAASLDVDEPERAARLHELGLTAVLAFPLITRGSTRGTVTWARTASYSAAELLFAEDFAMRAAAAIENARLYSVAQQAIVARETFLAVAAHEVRTPLQIVGLQLARLCKRHPGDEPDAILLRGAMRGANQLAGLFDRLFDVSLVRGGGIVLALAAVDLAHVVREVVADFQYSATRAGCQLTVDGIASLAGQWDRARLEQVILNLLTNAVRYARGKPIEVVVERVADAAVVTISDHGPGIAPADRERIFAEFERADRGVAPSGGLGLGLFLSRRIAELHGGTLDCVNLPRGGACFSFALPAPRLVQAAAVLETSLGSSPTAVSLAMQTSPPEDDQVA